MASGNRVEDKEYGSRPFAALIAAKCVKPRAQSPVLPLLCV